MTVPTRIVYFAALAQGLGLRSEQLELESPIKLAQLQAQLIERGGPWLQLAGAHIKAAVNQAMASGETWVNPGDEVAFFPPVTGG
jgi:molybdopterin synthase sulfur carrier subunit